MTDAVVQAIIERNESIARPGQSGATTVVGRMPGGPVLGSGETQFLSWAEWSGGQMVQRSAWRLGRPELTFALEPRMKEIAGTGQ